MAMFRIGPKADVKSLILVTDAAGSGIPAWDHCVPIATGPDCLLIRCRGDGDSEVVFGAVEEVDPGYKPMALRILQTPSKALVIGSLEGEILGRLPTLEAKTSVLVWANNVAMPDRIVIGVFSAKGIRVPAKINMQTWSNNPQDTASRHGSYAA